MHGSDRAEPGYEPGVQPVHLPRAQPVVVEHQDVPERPSVKAGRELRRPALEEAFELEERIAFGSGRRLSSARCGAIACSTSRRSPSGIFLIDPTSSQGGGMPCSDQPVMITLSSASRCVWIISESIVIDLRASASISRGSRSSAPSGSSKLRLIDSSQTSASPEVSSSTPLRSAQWSPWMTRMVRSCQYVGTAFVSVTLLVE